MKRIGILGGTFNPIHNGHIRLAIEACYELNLDEVHIMPCAIPPHKEQKGILPFDLRLRFIEEAVQDVPFLIADPLESTLPSPSYTWNTLNVFNDGKHNKNEIFFLMGAESFAALDSWHRGRELPQLAHLVMVPRAGDDWEVFTKSIQRLWHTNVYNVEYPDKLYTVTLEEGNCSFLPLPRLDISSTYVRALWRKKRNLYGLVPTKVINEMEKYRTIIDSSWGG